MPSKPSKNQNNISWWKRQSGQIQVAIIGAVTLLIVALVQQFGDNLLVYLASLNSVDAPTTTVGIDNDFNAVNGLYTTDSNNTQHRYVVLTNGCLVGHDSSGKQISKINGSNETELKGSVNLFIISDQEIFVDQIELELEQFEPIDTTTLSPIHAFVHGAGGGGETVIDAVRLDSVRLMSDNSHYNISILDKQQYAFQLPANATTGIKIPVTFSNPGSYKLKFIVHANTYNKKIEPFSTDIIQVNWIYTDTLDINNIQSSDATWSPCP